MLPMATMVTNPVKRSRHRPGIDAVDAGAFGMEPPEAEVSGTDASTTLPSCVSSDT